MRSRVITPEPRHKAVMDDLKAVLTRHQNSVNGYEMLALVSQLVGQLLALQDQTARSADAYLATVSKNIELGNAETVEAMLGGADTSKKN